MRKQCIGLLSWRIQTRPDVNHRICELASSASDAVNNDLDFIRWMRKSNQLMILIAKNPVKIFCRALIPWHANNGEELACGLRIFTFTDASFGTLRDHGSLESYFAIIGKSTSRDGETTCVGAFLDASARRVSRICRSSIASEAVAL